MASTRDRLYRRMVKRIKTPAAREGSARPQEGKTPAHVNKSREGIREDTEFSIDKTYTPDLENEGPERQIIHRMPVGIERRIRRIAKINAQVNNYIYGLVDKVWDMRPWREKTPEEIELEEEIKRRQKMERTLYKEGIEFAKRASRAYARMGLAYTPPAYQRSLINQTRYVEFSNIVADRNAIYMQIATDRLPYGVDVLSLVDDTNVLTNVSASLRHHVEGLYDVERGAWLCVERGRGVRGIPQEVTYKKQMELKPPAADRFTVPLGETVNSKRVYRSLKDFPHMLVAGSTGQGKTSYLNVILAALIENNTPEQVKIVLVDLKNGIEFDMYRGIPHLWKIGGNKVKEEEKIAPDGIVGRTDKVIKLLYRLRQEGERRLTLFKQRKVINIDEYNRKYRKSALDRIVVVIDEWARIALLPEGVEADRVLAEITATYRAVGFHVILATQTPIVRVVSTLIKTNFNARLAFGVPHNTASMVILDSNRAKGLSPVGRAIFQYGAHEIETQVPYITRGELLHIIKNAKEDGGQVEEGVSTLEILQYSLECLDGSLAIERIYQQFSDRIGHKAVAAKLKALDKMLIDIDGVEYIIEPPDYGNKPRMIKPYKKDPKPEKADTATLAVD